MRQGADGPSAAAAANSCERRREDEQSESPAESGGEIRPGVLYRHENRWPTAAEYDEAIAELELARTQLAPDGLSCAVCGDSGHQAFECHHNPLVVARRWTAAISVWRCYHCGFTATSDAEASAHFGATDTGDPTSCLLAKIHAQEAELDALRARVGARRDHC